MASVCGNNSTGNLLMKEDGIICGSSGTVYCTECSSQPKEEYTVSISGMPSVCTAQLFNGVWTLAWSEDCYWHYDIDAYRRVSLGMTAYGYIVYWRVYGSVSGSFNSSSGEYCKPETATWEPLDCLEVFGCWGLCSQFYANATCVVA